MRSAALQRAFALGAAALALGSGPAPAPAAQARPAGAGLFVELNAAAPVDDGCRLTFVMRNALAADIGELALEVVSFDRDGRVGQFVLLKTGELPKGKSRVRQFDLAGEGCGEISRILVNDVTECSADGITARDCLAALVVSSRAAIKLEL